MPYVIDPRIKDNPFLTKPFVIPVRANVEKVIYNDLATIVIWSDGTKTVVKCQPGDTYDKEKGLLMCICKKYFGNTGNFNEVLKKWVPEETTAKEIKDYSTMWERLKDDIVSALDEGHQMGYDRKDSREYGKYFVYKRLLDRMALLEEVPL